METPHIFFIKMQNGLPEGSPFILENLLQCNIDPRNSADWAEFLPQPLVDRIGKYQVPELQYVVEGGKVLGKHVLRDMTQEERSQLSPDPLLQLTGSPPDVIE